jgi:hypothetical protein
MESSIPRILESHPSNPGNQNGTAKDAKNAKRTQIMSVRTQLCVLLVNSYRGSWVESYPLTPA